MPDHTIVLVDVDGVLNPLTEHPDAAITGFDDWKRIPAADLPPLWRDIAMAHRSPTQLALLAALPACELVWATTWADLANDIYEQGAPPRRWIDPRPTKRDAVKAWLSTLPAGQRVLWIDDDLRPGRPLDDIRDGPAHVTRLATTPELGLTRATLDHIRGRLEDGSDDA